MAPITFDELETMARTVWGEARGESNDGKRAVAMVILDRVAKQGWMGKTVQQVCMLPHQFSCWNAGDPNREKLIAVNLDDAAFRDCINACVREISDRETRAAGAKLICHYHHRDVFPSWSVGHEPMLKIGNHVFYDDID